MKIGMYSPYVPGNTGGGEKQFFDVAVTLSKRHQIDIAVPTTAVSQLPERIAAYEQFLGADLSQLNWVASPLCDTSSVIQKLRWTKQYDYLYSFTDGSLFFSAAKKNNLHFQVPFATSPRSIVDRLKLQSWQTKNANSLFTKQVIEQAWHTRVQFVHYPMVDVQHLRDLAQPKKKTILSVGRFFRQLHSKRQDVLIESFAQLRKTNPQLTADWTLELVGAVEDESYLAQLKQQAADLPVEFVLNCSRKELENRYARSSIFWHAAGYQVDEAVHPEQVEHFGIATVEAMAAGVVPVVVYKGGQKEILGQQLAKLGWQTIDECVAKTLDLIKDSGTRTQLAQQCQQQAKLFGPDAFRTTLEAMIGDKV